MGRPAVATSRFATAGCFTAEQLEKGADLEAIQESQASDGPDFDPDDKRSLYERLMEQKDAKQAEWEHRHCLLYTSPSPRDATLSRMPSSA